MDFIWLGDLLLRTQAVISPLPLYGDSTQIQ